MATPSDKTILAMATEYADLKSRLLDALLAREKAGKAGSVEGGGVKVALRRNLTKHWDVKALAAKLTRSEAAKVIVRRVDGRALARAIRNGDVDQAEADSCIESQTLSAPFVDVTVKPPTQ